MRTMSAFEDEDGFWHVTLYGKGGICVIPKAKVEVTAFADISEAQRLLMYEILNENKL